MQVCQVLLLLLCCPTLSVSSSFRTSAGPCLPEKATAADECRSRKRLANHLRKLTFAKFPPEQKLYLKVKPNKTGYRNRKKTIYRLFTKVTSGDHQGAPSWTTGGDMSQVGMQRCSNTGILGWMLAADAAVEHQDGR